MDILDFLAQDNYICYNKKLAKEIGINETIIFMYFVSQYKRFQFQNQLGEDGYFYKTSDDIYENTGLSRYQQKQAIDNLRDRGLIDYKVKGVPATLHFTIFKDSLQTLFSPSFEETGKLDLKKLQNKIVRNSKTSLKETAKHYNTNINNNIIIKNNIEYYSFVKDFISLENHQIRYQIEKQGEDVYFQKQYLEIDKLEKDGYPLEAIQTVLLFIKQDSFWNKNILSIKKLREKDRNGNPYIVRMIDEIRNWKPVNKIGVLPGFN